MIVVDRRGLVRFVNTTGQLLLRQSSAEVVGKPFEFPVAAEATSEVNIKRPEWEPIIAELRAADAVWEGEPALVISLRDITQRKRDEQKIREQQHKLELANAQLEALATQDGLTGLQNHRVFKERLEEECQRAVRYRLPLALILLDVDHFKEYNDAFGHPAGDEVLKTVARLVREHSRETDFVARYGGEEFAVLLPNTGLRDAVGLAEKMRESIARSASARRMTTASFGIASMMECPCTAADFLSATDHALYASKQKGRNRVTTAATSGVTKNAA
jgi:diguanylate cyclase (GGDEF)-like protein